MREKFREFYEPTQEEIDDYWAKAIFSFDANVLLNLYRYTEQTRDEILEILENLSNGKRLWISYQTAYEYQKNRLSVIDRQRRTYGSLIDSLGKRQKELEADLNSYKKHSYLEVEQFKTEINQLFEKLTAKLNDLKNEHPDYLENDPIFEKLTEILNDCVSDEFSDDDLSNLYKEGKDRYEKKIPPGYMDMEKEKKGEQSLYGDLIIWKSLIRKSIDEGVKLIFVTDDLKEDWWYMFNGKTIYPRPELIKEFKRETSQTILIYKPEQFLHFSKTTLKAELNDKTLNEVENTRKIDEQNSKLFEDYLEDKKSALLDSATNWDFLQSSGISEDILKKWATVRPSDNFFNPFWVIQNGGSYDLSKKLIELARLNRSLNPSQHSNIDAIVEKWALLKAHKTDELLNEDSNKKERVPKNQSKGNSSGETKDADT